MPLNFWHSYSAPHFWPRDTAGVVGVLSFVAVLVILELVLKGLALYRAARLKQTAWFVILLIVNSAGIVPLIYLLVTKPETKA